ncbi:dihydrodipicolinate synthase family protein [Pseudomaricurvus alkylphenolicus]|uniref:dihydrodipicolinate synthase family protein n=1 Tax=Pseudomaricurvus alkylphenolicus TaxID=1306991 RepID=UPI00142278C7|nr:dihydrodipicolinate synthase family protein [Pseudomaricurvus alkylphenolicus]NIB40302.1 dihydrodipicolinate synthase family protein [Pseudomaricurvus alkylphenolicus]
MDRNSVQWRGYIPAITTPFTKEGELDCESLRKLLSWLNREGMHGVITAGTQGEWFTLSFEEKRYLLETVSSELRGKCTIIAGCNGYTAAEVIRNSELAQGFGFDGILLSAPPYMKLTDNEIYEFYAEVSGEISLPICVYNWPPGTNVDMSLELLQKLAELDKVVAIKNSTPDQRHFLNVFYALKDKVRVFGIPMSDLGITLVQQDNADGMMGAGAILGRDHPDFFNAIWAGDIETARIIAKKDTTLMQAWFNSDYTGKFGSAQAIFKEALNQQGLPGGYPRSPILPLDERGVDEVRKTLLAVGRLPNEEL